MNAIQFIQQNGVDKAREVVAAYHGIPSYTFKEKTERGYSSCKSVDLDDLNRLVRSVDIIKEFGGCEEASNRAYELTMQVLGFDPSRIEQAIADYEAIYSNDCEILDHPEDYTSPNCKKYDERVK